MTIVACGSEPVPENGAIHECPASKGARHESGAAAVTWGRLAACAAVGNRRYPVQTRQLADCQSAAAYQAAPQQRPLPSVGDRKSTRLNCSHANISYAVFCLK